MTSITERVARPDLAFPLSPEVYPGLEIVENHMALVTSHTAIAVALGVRELAHVPDGVKLTKLAKKTRVDMLDSRAQKEFEGWLRRAPFGVRAVGSEGLKELEKQGLELEVVMGHFGDASGGLVDQINDVIDNSNAATRNRPGAISVMGVSTAGGLLPTPDPRVSKYFDKNYAPPEVAGNINALEMTVAERIAMTRDVFGVPAKEITVVTMNRKANDYVRDGVKQIGAQLVEIEDGDLLPSFLALISPRKHGKGIFLQMGRGGPEEGGISAVVGRAQGSHVESRMWNPSEDDDQKPRNEVRRLYTLDDLVPGYSDHSFVAYTPVTHDPWFDIPGVRISENETYALAQSVIIDHRGFHIQPVEMPLS